jgi:Xaa-Pro aminopeptidase
MRRAFIAKGVSMPAAAEAKAPFDWRKLDRIMEERDIDVLLVTSKHNIQYLLGGYRFFFFDSADAIGLSRYLPVLVYPRGRPDRATYIGNVMESYEQELGSFWTPNVLPRTWGTQDAIKQALEVIHGFDRPPRRIGIEAGFLPADAFQTLQAGVENATIVDALIPLERLRAVKSKEELAILRTASERVVDSMLAVIASARPGMTKRQMADALKREEQKRDLLFEYCLVTTGTGFNRAPTDKQRWNAGEIASLDSGGNYRGYIGDLCRMAIFGEPDNEQKDLLAAIEAAQQAARRPIRAGTIGKEIYAAAEAVLAKDPNRAQTTFVAHGMGIVSHEAPRLSSRAPVPYPGDDENLPLQEGMVISIETTLSHPKRGFIKLEDTVAVTANGWEAYGDTGRGWNIAGTAA